jgi:AraC-like DNA-binding protein
MLFEFGFYSSVLLIFFVHALVYAFLLFKKAIVNETKPEIYLGFILILCALYLCPWMLGFAGWYNDSNPIYKQTIFYIPFQQMLFIGPLVYYYVQSLLNPGFVLTKKHKLHFFPGILYFAYSFLMFVCDQFILDKIYFYADWQDREFDLWYQVVSILSVSYYLFLSIRFYINYRKIIFHITSNAYNTQFKWVRNFLLSFAFYILLFVGFKLVDLFISELNYRQNWWFYLVFAITVYYIAIQGYANAIITKVPFYFIQKNTKLQLQLSTNLIENPIIEDIDAIEIVDNKIEDKDLLNWKSKITEALIKDKLYEDAELSLPEFAKKLHTNPAILSKSINKGFDMNFNDLINYHRVKAVEKMLQQGEQKNQTLLGIAYDCGFNSKATFNRAFKKVHQISPKEWLEKTS